jgi:hypothetical protein
MVDRIWPNIRHDSENRLFYLGNPSLEQAGKITCDITSGFEDAKMRAKSTHEAFYSDWKSVNGFPLVSTAYAIISTIADEVTSEEIFPRGVVLEAESYLDHSQRLIHSELALLTRTKGGVFLLTQKVQNTGIDIKFLYETGMKFGRELEIVKAPIYTDFSQIREYSESRELLRADFDSRVWADHAARKERRSLRSRFF